MADLEFWSISGWGGGQMAETVAVVSQDVRMGKAEK